MTDQHVIKPVLPVRAGSQRSQLDALVGKDTTGFQNKLVRVLKVAAALIEVQIKRQDRVAVLERYESRSGPVIPLPGEAPAVAFLAPSPMTNGRTKRLC